MLPRMSLLASLKTTAWAYPALEVMHITGIALLLGNLLALEVRLWLRDSSLPVDALAHLTLRLAATGFGLATFSGLLMFSTQPGELLAKPRLRCEDDADRDRRLQRRPVSCARIA